jgi:GNAT superfamily N-acetyltransferase
MMRFTCECGASIEGDDLAALGDTFLAHVRAAHEDWPFPDQAIRNYAEATQRLTGGTERLDTIGAITVERVTAERVDDWLAFFDHDAFAGKPEWAGCYCLEPHDYDPANPPDVGNRHWSVPRTQMVDRLKSGGTYGYLAYVDGRPGGWVNASLRSDYALYRTGTDDADVIGVSCFIIAPPYRRHGLADALLDRVIADAPGRGAAWIEAYPFNAAGDDDAGNFRGPRRMYEARGFTEADRTERHTVMRRPV